MTLVTRELVDRHELDSLVSSSHGGCCDTLDIAAHLPSSGVHQRRDETGRPWLSVYLSDPSLEGRPSMTSLALRAFQHIAFRVYPVLKDQGTCIRRISGSSRISLAARE